MIFDINYMLNWTTTFCKRKKFTYTCKQGMYKNRVENDRIFFEIPALLSCERGNPAENGAGKFKIYMLF